jgi:hypothetical protein
VYSTTLESVSSAKARIERTFEPDTVRTLKAEADHDLTIDGPNLAAQAIAAGLVDEYLLSSPRAWSAAASGSSPTACAYSTSWPGSSRAPVH